VRESITTDNPSDPTHLVRVAVTSNSFATSPILPAMAKICHVCAKGPAYGNSRSHSMVATRRRFEPNLQRVRIDDAGTPKRVYVCTRCLKAGKVTKAR
jgi:large subunit ribosomal protein L28